MSIAGVVKVQVVVAPNGSVKTTKVVGGHPLLVNAAVDAVKKWRFESAAEETTGVVNSSLIRTRASSKRILLRCSRLSASGPGWDGGAAMTLGKKLYLSLRCASRSRLFVHRQLDGRPAGA